MISYLRKEVQEERKLIREDINELRSNTTKVMDRMSARMYIFENTMPSATVIYDVAQLSNNANVFLEGRNVLSNEMDLQFSRVAEQLGPLEQKNDKNSTPVSVLKGRRNQDKKSVYPSDTDSGLFEDSLTVDSEEEPQLSRRAK